MAAPVRDALSRLASEGLPAGSPLAYLFALACIAVAAIAHLVIAQFTSDLTPSILYNPAVFIASLAGGIGPGLVAIGTSVGMLWWAFGSRSFGGQISALAPTLNAGIYAAAALVIVWVAERYRASAQAATAERQPAVDAKAGRENGLAPSSAHPLRQRARSLMRHPLSGYIGAIACIGVATLIRLAFGRLGGAMLPLVSYYPAILLAALMGGTGAGMLAMALSLCVVWLEFPGPFLSLGAPTREESVGLSLYVFVSLLTVWLAEKRRHAFGAEQPPLLRLVASLLVAAAAVLLTTFVLLAIDSWLEPEHLVLGYLVPTVVIAMHYGSTLAVLSSFISGITAAYFLFPPKFSFYIAEPVHIAELGLFLLLAIIASNAVAALSDDARGRDSRSL